MSDGLELEGNFEHGELKGLGKRSCPAFVEEGNFEIFDSKTSRWISELDGKGKITFPDGTFLAGDFKIGEIDGKRTLPDGEVTEGTLLHGQLRKGKSTLPNVEVCQGEYDKAGDFVKGTITDLKTGHVRHIDEDKGTDLEHYPDGRILDKKKDLFL